MVRLVESRFEDVALCCSVGSQRHHHRYEVKSAEATAKQSRCLVAHSLQSKNQVNSLSGGSSLGDVLQSQKVSSRSSLMSPLRYRFTLQ